MNPYKLLIPFCIFVCMSCNDKDLEQTALDVITNATIYKSDSLYCAFCDMVYYNDKYYVAFRCANTHAPTNERQQNGFIKIMSSFDGLSWTDDLNIIDDEWDLRDPSFCFNTDTNVLTLNCGVYRYNNPNPKIKNELVTLSFNGSKLEIDSIDFIDIEVGALSYKWIWKMYYNDHQYWGVAYYTDEYPVLVTSKDGISFRVVSEIPVKGNETALLFEEDIIYAVTRNIASAENAFMSESIKPYFQWNSHELNQSIASPEIVRMNYDKFFIAGRSQYGVSIFEYNPQNHILKEYINLFAKAMNNGDRGYPGMLCHDGFLFIIYYACNDHATFPSIYLTRIKLL